MTENKESVRVRQQMITALERRKKAIEKSIREKQEAIGLIESEMKTHRDAIAAFEQKPGA